MSTVVSIQARLGSTRLPGKVLLPIGERRILEWVVKRVRTGAGNTADIVVAVGDEPENDAIVELCERRGFEYVVGPESDLLERHRRVVRSGGYERLVRITADCPFVPSSEIERVLTEHTAGGHRYTRNDWPPGTDLRMPIGTAVETFDADFLERLANEGATHPNRRPLESPDEYAVAFSPNEDWEQFSHAHIAVDTPADYWRLVDAMEEVGDSPRAIAEWLVQ